MNQNDRTALLLGKNAVTLLAGAHVAVFGLGGVGSFAAEALARGGVGRLTLCDNDTVNTTNINRQLIALHSTVGKSKVSLMRNRILDINPEAVVTALELFYSEDNTVDLTGFSYVVDAIDTVSCKLALILNAKKAGVPVISAMGAGNKLDPTAFEVTDISRTSGCPLARVVRRELRNKGVHELKVVYSREQPVNPHGVLNADGRHAPGSVSFVPPVAGFILAGEVIKDLIGVNQR